MAQTIYTRDKLIALIMLLSISEIAVQNRSYLQNHGLGWTLHQSQRHRLDFRYDRPHLRNVGPKWTLPLKMIRRINQDSQRITIDSIMNRAD